MASETTFITKHPEVPADLLYRIYVAMQSTEVVWRHERDCDGWEQDMDGYAALLASLCRELLPIMDANDVPSSFRFFDDELWECRSDGSRIARHALRDAKEDAAP